MVFAASLGVMAVATLMLWGWGCAFRRMFGMECTSWPATTALGMAVVIFAGGILNLARLAFSPAPVGGGGVGWSFSCCGRFLFAVSLRFRFVWCLCFVSLSPPGRYCGREFIKNTTIKKKKK